MLLTKSRHYRDLPEAARKLATAKRSFLRRGRWLEREKARRFQPISSVSAGPLAGGASRRRKYAGKSTWRRRRKAQDGGGSSEERCTALRYGSDGATQRHGGAQMGREEMFAESSREAGKAGHPRVRVGVPAPCVALCYSFAAMQARCAAPLFVASLGQPSAPVCAAEPSPPTRTPAPPPRAVRLDYIRGPGAERCPGEQVFRDAISAAEVLRTRLRRAQIEPDPEIQIPQ